MSLFMGSSILNLIQVLLMTIILLRRYFQKDIVGDSTTTNLPNEMDLIEKHAISSTNKNNNK